MSRKNKIEKKSNDDVIFVFKSLLKVRILIDFRFYKAMCDLCTFKMKWCCWEGLCKIDDDELFFCF